MCPGRRSRQGRGPPHSPPGRRTDAPPSLQPGTRHRTLERPEHKLIAHHPIEPTQCQPKARGRWPQNWPGWPRIRVLQQGAALQVELIIAPARRRFDRKQSKRTWPRSSFLKGALRPLRPKNRQTRWAPGFAPPRSLASSANKRRVSGWTLPGWCREGPPISGLGRARPPADRTNPPGACGQRGGLHGPEPQEEKQRRHPHVDGIPAQRRVADDRADAQFSHRRPDPLGLVRPRTNRDGGTPRQPRIPGAIGPILHQPVPVVGREERRQLDERRAPLPPSASSPARKSSVGPTQSLKRR